MVTLPKLMFSPFDTYICLLCDEVLLPWNFGNPGFDVKALHDPPNMNFFLHILDLDLQILIGLLPYFTCTYIYIGERIAGKQDKPSLIIEVSAPSPPPPKVLFKFLPIYENGLLVVFPCYAYVFK